MCYRTCLRILRREGFSEPYRTNPKRKHDMPYQTPPYPGDKWQTGVKFVPKECSAPKHNGKVERSHRIDQERFYRHLSFYSLEDLRRQGASWLRRHDSRSRPVLGLMSPDEDEVAKLRELHGNEGEARCRRLLRRFTSSFS